MPFRLGVLAGNDQREFPETDRWGSDLEEPNWNPRDSESSPVVGSFHGSALPGSFRLLYSAARHRSRSALV